MTKRVLLCSIILSLLTGCGGHKKYYDRKKITLQKSFFAGPLRDGPLTVFIHGTKQSLLSRMVHKLDYPLGIVSSSITTTNSVLAGIARSLNIADPLEYPRDSFYFYGWPGKMNFPARFKAAERLYGVIKDHKGPLTVIAHSHGCNVALNLATLAAEDPQSTFSVDRLILLAPPVQEVTKPLVHSPVFKEVYNFYSTADLFQIGDPQGIYWESYHCTEPGTKVPLFSSRTYKPAPNLMQARILLDWQSPGHIHFMLSRFLTKLPLLMRMTKDASAAGGYERCRNCYIINLPLFNQPVHFVEPCQLKGRYVPRSSYYKDRRKFAKSAKISMD